MKPLMLMLALVGTALPSQVQSQSRNWTTIATAHTLTRAGSEWMTVRSSRHFREVRLCVDRRALWISEFRVVYSNRPEQRVTVSRTIRPGACTFPGHLRRDGGTIRSIRFSHGRAPASGTRPTVRAQAR
jgi:hypothetical protein